MEAGKQANVTLVKTPEFGTGEHVAGLVRMSTIHNNVDTLSRCILMPLEAADQVHIQNVHDVITSTEKGRETSFMGFQYKPGLTRVSVKISYFQTLTGILVQEPRGQNLISLHPPTDGISWYHMKVQDLSCPTRVGVLTGGVSVTMVTRVE